MCGTRAEADAVVDYEQDVRSEEEEHDMFGSGGEEVEHDEGVISGRRGGGCFLFSVVRVARRRSIVLWRG